MKKFILFSFLLLTSNLLLAQTGEGNNNGQTPPDYQNPYGTNPYGTNPYGNNKGTNIFNNENDDKKNGENTTNPDKKNNNNSSTNDKKENPDGTKTLDFSDRNEVDKGKTDAELREKYKNDPDYLKYIGLDPEEGENGEDENDKNVVSETEDMEGAVYGANFLTSSSGFGSQNLTTVPEDYRLGVGDEVVVSVWGSAEFQSPFTISKDGSIFPNRVGKIFLQGLSFQAARSVIRSKFKRVLPSGSNVDIVMGKIRTIRVYVYDQVKQPGMITMSALNTPLNALQRAGGLTSLGNLRDIQIRRNGIVIERIDLYEYLKTGSNGREFYMEDNDVITVGLYDKIVSAQGAFKRPMRYQLTKYGTLSDLIELAGGARFDARKSLIRIKTVFDEKEQYIDINGKDFLSDQDYLLKDGDVVMMNPINEGVSNVVTISGGVPYPDQYQISEGDRIFDLIKKAGGLLPDVYKSRAYVYRNGITSDESKALKINIGDYGINDSKENILLQNGDAIQILSESRFDNKFYVQVMGLVKFKGNFKYKPNLKLKDVLIMAGGIDLDAESGRIEISNITDSVNRYSITGNNVNVKVVSINPDLSIDEVSENIIIKPYDIIFVRKKKDIKEHKLVSIDGQVDYPGQYTLLGEKERLTSLLIRTGGLTKDAWPEGAKLYRKNYGPIVIDFKDAMRNAGGKDDIILEEGDKIIIPKKNDIVMVQGNVQYPINIKYDRAKQGVMDYVDAAGGFGDRPWKRRISVRYQNGKHKSTKNFLFFKFYPKVEAGSIVSVPSKPPPRKINFDLAQVVQYGLTTATSILTVVLLINNVK
jgi:protein involved in polysaccharide export with SLBB domain